MNDNISKEFNLNSKVDYFVSYYLYKTDLYKIKSTNSSILNLHNLINLIIEELSKNNINRNLKFFYNKLQEIKNKDKIIKNKYDYKINEILQNMISNKEYALIVSKNLLSEIDNGKYGKEICNRIEQILFNDKPLENIKEELDYLIEALLIEYIIYGYNETSLEKIIYNIFSKYTIHNKYVSTDFPIPLEIENNKIPEYIDNLNIQNRINSLKHYYNKKASKYYYLFNIRGITGLDLNLHLNNVEIYNWKTSHKFNVEIDKKIQKDCIGYGNYENNDIHCSIYVESVDKENIFNKIKRQLDEALDILYTYNNLECKPLVDYSHYIVFDENKNIVSEGMTRQYDEDFKREVRPLRYDSRDEVSKLNAEYNNYSKYILNNSTVSSEIVKNSVRYYRKGKESTNIEDKILNYWICIENILKININLPKSILGKEDDDLKFKKIKSIVPILTCQTNLIATYWLIYDYFSNKYLYNKIAIGKTNAKSLQFVDNQVNLIEFINNYELLENKFSSQLDIDIYEKYFKLLYDKSSVQMYIKKYISTTQDILLLSYRYRNMIVHNAQYDLTFINFYAQQLELIAIRLLNVITSEIYKCESKKDLQNIIINKYVDQQQMVNNFNSINLKTWFNTIDK
jgi:hypothetical protein